MKNLLYISHYEASFECTFSSGTRKDVAHFVFTVNISFANGASTDVVVESKPFIVITNECQYGDSLSVLFKYDTFLQQPGYEVRSIPWVYFANNLQRYFLSLLRRGKSKTNRELSPSDLMHINQKFCNGDTVSIEQCTDMWKYLEKVFHRIRYQRPILEIWSHGYILGFVGREFAESLVINFPDGSFVIRFSESKPESFAITCKSPTKIINTLADSKEFKGHIKSLPDYIR